MDWSDRHRFAPAPAAILRLLTALLLSWFAPGAALSAASLLQPEWLASRLADPDIQLVDVRAPAAYAAGHIAGAVNLPVDATFGSGDRADRLAGVTVVRDLFSRAGLRADRHVVLYDDGSFIHAARLFWVLEVFGQPRVSILNLGFDGWSRQGRPTSTQPTVAAPSDYRPRIQPKRMATALTTRVAMNNPQVTIVDARAADEFAGERSIASRFGHIPGAVSIPWSDNLEAGPDGTRLAALDRLGALYRDKVGDRQVIAYCNKGKQSALAYFVLRNLGYEVAAYDGSWFEWGNSPHLPIVNPQAGDTSP